MSSKQKHVSSLLIPYPPSFNPFPTQETDGSLIGRFESMALLHPGNLAVCDQEIRYTYDELNTSANRLAHAILGAAGNQNKTIAFFAYHNAWSIVTILALLKAGKTYLALSPTFPQERLESLLRTVKASHVVSTPEATSLWKQLRKRIPSLGNISTEMIAEGKSENPGLLLDLAIPPYVSYTSGTTGIPKVILQENRGLLCQVRDYTNDFGLSPQDRFALFNPLSYGGGSFALWGALMNGASLHMYDIRNQGLQEIPGWIAREAISVLNMPPPVFRNIFGNLVPGFSVPSVRVIVLAGDTMINRELEIVRQHFSQS
jgi:non-ribosomal peptide synthetase component F